MAENKDPMDVFNSNLRQFNTPQGNTVCSWRYLEQPCLSQQLSSSMDIVTSRPVRNLESCRFRSSSLRSDRDTTFCEIVQQSSSSSATHHQRRRNNSYRLQSGSHSSHHRQRRSYFPCRKRLHRSQFCSRRHRQVALHSESRDYRRRRHTTLAQRKAANVREQKRMVNLKEAFRSLRECLPTLSYEKKLSRIDTLRLAILYIHFLKQLADGKSPDELEWTEAKS